ncbi:MAG TPA: hypothetical protein VET90_01435 [Candidatus Binatus sp.]|nr:hypothetical protein [Candidatus Binatus sp.]
MIQDTLALWQDAESLLDRVPLAASDRDAVQRLVAELRASYAQLTSARDWSRAELDRRRRSIRDGRALLVRLDGGRPESDPPA